MSKYGNIEQYAEMFKALSNPNRLRIFLRLISCCSPGTVWSLPEKSNSASEVCPCVGDLGQDLGIVPSTLSHHIKELRQAGLIRMKRNGQKIEYFVDPEAVTALNDFFNPPG
jgi:ArsR family transcriptional regulator, arsenate/arsenite/antimonite-responsive transcriptional repressor